MSWAIIAHDMGDYPYLPRLAVDLLRRAADASPVVILMGARQTGKSTLVRSEPLFTDYRYLTLDDLDIQERAAQAPGDLLAAAPRVIIDEVQRDPALILAIKRAVDQQHPRTPGRFVLTGSANLLLMQRVSETLAGRATYVTLWPLTRRERLGLGCAGIWDDLFEHEVRDWFDLITSNAAPVANWREEVVAGGYPVPSTMMPDAATRTIWFDGYVRTYLERDLQTLASIDNLLDFRRLMKAVSLRVGSLLNQAEIARDIGIPRSTVQRYLNLLETSFQTLRLEPYSVNRTRRLIKSPKIFWTDTGLAFHLSGGLEPGGAHLENLVLTDLLAWRDAQIPRPEVHNWLPTTTA